MSVYTQPQQQLGQQQPYSQQFQQPLTQLPFGQQQSAFQTHPQQQYGQQPQYGQQQYGQQPQIGQWQQGPQAVTELALRCAASAVSAVAEHLRMDQQALMGIQTQGQIPPHTWSNLLVECARRIAPMLHAGCPQVAQAQFGGQIQPQQLSGQFQQPQGTFPQQMSGQFGGIPQAGFLQQPQYGPGM